MHPYRHAQATPDKAAVIVAESGIVLTYAELDRASNRAARLFRARGLEAGDRVAILMDNTPDYFGLVWGAQRSGLLFVAISTKLTAPEVDYILEDSGAKLLIFSAGLPGGQSDLPKLVHGADEGEIERVETALAAQDDTPVSDEQAGYAMLYSSGTTGRPKGVKLPPPLDPAIDAPTALAMLAAGFFGLGADSVYLSTAPLYHAAPLAWTMTVQKLGGTIVLMRKFDPEAALMAIERYRCNAGQFVPTHFVRMLKLPEEARLAHDVSSMKCAIHAAAPCPVPVKRAMIEWWGPVLDEYYAGTEGNGFTAIKSPAWLEHPGSVGTAIGEAKLHICDEDGNDLPPRAEGMVFFESARQFEYHNDPVKTAESRNARGFSTLGDVGWVDEAGLSLPDRPQELHDHFGRREYLPAGDREPSDRASGGGRCRRGRRAR